MFYNRLKLQNTLKSCILSPRQRWGERVKKFIWTEFGINLL